MASKVIGEIIMNRNRIIYLGMIIFSILVPSTSQAKLNWEQYLDVAYKVTWWEENEIREWIKQTEGELGQNLESFSSAWQSNIKDTAESAGTIRTDDDRNSFPHQIYKRLAIAELLLFIKTHEQQRLNEAVRVIGLIGKDQLKPDVAFWYHYIHAFKYTQVNDPKVKNAYFIKSVYKLWIDVILKLEKAQTISSIPVVEASAVNPYGDLPYLYENIVSLIIKKAIIDNQMQDLEALGSIIWAVERRLTIKDGYGEQVKLINKRIYGPKSDVFRLNYTVVYLEAEKYRYKAQTLLDQEGPTANSEEALLQALSYYGLAFKYARTRQGKVSAISDHIDLVSFAMARVPERSSLAWDQKLKTIVGHEGANIASQAIRLFDELAKMEVQEYLFPGGSSELKENQEKKPSISYWEKNGFSDRPTYIYAMHSLWRSIAELCLWTANYYFKEIKSDNIKDFYRDAPSGQAALSQYLDFFERNVSKHYLEIVPDNAYFSAAEAASNIFDIYHHLAPYGSGSNIYDLAFARLLQSVEIFPFNLNGIDKLARFLSAESSLDHYDKILPLPDNITNSHVIKNWPDAGSFPGLEKLIKDTPKIIHKSATINFLQTTGDPLLKKEVKREIEEINEEIKNYSLQSQIRLEFSDNFSELNEQLKKIEPGLSAKDFIAKNPQAWKLVAKIKNLGLRIQNLTEASDLVAAYPAYNKISNELKDTLLRNTEHPLHTLLRRFYHERNPEHLSYVKYVRIQEIEEEVEVEKSETEKEVPKQEEKVIEEKKDEKAMPSGEMKKPAEGKDKPLEEEPKFNIDEIMNNLETGG